MGVRLLLVAVALAGQSDTTSTAERSDFVRQAIEDRFKAANIPDFDLLQGSRRIAIREEMPQAKGSVARAALPRIDGYEFYLIATDAAQAEADRTGRNVYFITVDRPSIAGESATVSLGVDLVFPKDPKVVKLCCCSGDGEFRRVQGRWIFVRWTDRICS